MKGLFLSALATFPALYNAQTVITLSSEAAQVINGVGASGAWWPLDLANFPESVRETAAKMLFDSSVSSAGGAGFTSYRYNVGGGGVGVGNPSRAPETFYVSEGNYNWSADAAGVYFLQQAASYGVPIITAFVNSAPPAFTSNGQSCGGTLVDASIPAYAQYLADVIAHFKDEGIIFTHVSPMNEPDNSFGGDPCGQEGMIVTPSQRASVVNILRSALDSAGLDDVTIMADESSTVQIFSSEASQWLPLAAADIGAISHHQYSFADDASVAAMGELARNLSGKETWFTEICCFGAEDSTQVDNPAAALTYTQGYDPTMVGALQLGQIIFQSFTQTRYISLDAHFDFWTALSGAIGCEPSAVTTCQTETNTEGWNDGLIYYDGDYSSTGNTNLYYSKRYFVFKHFTRFAFQGSTRYDVQGAPDDVLALVFRAESPHETEMGTASSSLILMNLGTNLQQIDFTQLGLGSSIGGIFTSSEYDFQESTVGSYVQLPPQTVITLLFN